MQELQEHICVCVCINVLTLLSHPGKTNPFAHIIKTGHYRRTCSQRGDLGGREVQLAGSLRKEQSVEHHLLRGRRKAPCAARHGDERRISLHLGAF